MCQHSSDQHATNLVLSKQQGLLANEDNGSKTSKRLPAFPDRSGVWSDLTFRFGRPTIFECHHLWLAVASPASSCKVNPLHMAVLSASCTKGISFGSNGSLKVIIIAKLAVTKIFRSCHEILSFGAIPTIFFGSDACTPVGTLTVKSSDLLTGA